MGTPHLWRCPSLGTCHMQMARACTTLGQREQAQWYIDRAMHYSKQLEAMLHSEEVPGDSQEQCVVQLFSLYIEAAKTATEARQQVGGAARAGRGAPISHNASSTPRCVLWPGVAVRCWHLQLAQPREGQPAAHGCPMQSLASNLVARAVQLSRHDAVSPDSAVSMCISVTQLQLQQASAASSNMVAVALLMGAYQQLVAAEQPAAESSNAQLRLGVVELKQEVG